MISCYEIFNHFSFLIYSFCQKFLKSEIKLDYNLHFKIYNSELDFALHAIHMKRICEFETCVGQHLEFWNLDPLLLVNDHYCVKGLKNLATLVLESRVCNNKYFFITANRGLGFLKTLFVQYYSAIRGPPGRDSNPGRVV